jgi:hypothetical protein
MVMLGIAASVPKWSSCSCITSASPIRRLLRGGDHQGGFYHAFLVEADENGEVDTYHAIHVEDLVWFYESEYVPAG